MKKYLTVIFITLLPSLLFANEGETKKVLFSIGFESLAVSSINTVSTPERVNHLTISPIPYFSFSFDYPLTNDYKHIIKALFSYGEITEKIELTKPAPTDNLLPIESIYELTIYYLGFQLAYEFYHIGLGFGFKYPIKGKTEYSVDTKDLASIFDFHIAYYLSVLERETIEIQFVSKINFALSGQLKNYPKSDPFAEFEHSSRTELTKRYNPHPITFAIGFIFKYNFWQ